MPVGPDLSTNVYKSKVFVDFIKIVSFLNCYYRESSDQT